MKRKSIIFMISFVLAVFMGKAQVFVENFESVDCISGVGNVPASWTMYNDGNKPQQGLNKYNFAAYAWRVASDADRQYAVSPSFFEQPKQADRWLVSPEISLSQTSNPYLVCWARAIDNTARDGFVVKLSMGGAAKTDFTVDLAKVGQERNGWTQHIYKLSDYKSGKIRLAWVQNSEDKYMIALDDIMVYDVTEQNKVEVSFSLAPIILSDQKIEMSGYLQNLGKETITSCRVNYSINGGTPVQKDISDLSVSSMQTVPISGAACDVSSYGGKTLTLSFWVSRINGGDIESAKISQSVTVLKKEDLPQKNALFEGFSSGTCGPCAVSNVMLHKLLPSQGANQSKSGLCAVKYQVEIPQPGDPAVTEETEKRRVLYKVLGAPSFFVGGKKVLTDETSLREAFKAEQVQKSPIMLHAQSLLQDSSFHVRVNVMPYIPQTQECRLFVVILEDSIVHASNGNGETHFYYIARKMLPNAEGTIVRLDKVGDRREMKYDYTFNMENPLVFTNTQNMTVLAFVQNMVTLEVLQVILGETIGYAKEGSVRNFEELYIVPNPASSASKSEAHLKLIKTTGLSVQVFDMAGHLVWKDTRKEYTSGSHTFSLPSSLKSGMYFVRFKADTGVGSTLKWIVK